MPMHTTEAMFACVSEQPADHSLLLLVMRATNEVAIKLSSGQQSTIQLPRGLCTQSASKTVGGKSVLAQQAMVYFITAWQSGKVC